MLALYNTEIQYAFIIGSSALAATSIDGQLRSQEWDGERGRDATDDQPTCKIPPGYSSETRAGNVVCVRPVSVHDASMIDEDIVTGRKYPRGQNRDPPIAHEKRQSKCDVHRRCPSKQDIHGDTDEFRTDVMFKPAAVDGNQFGDECDCSTTTKKGNHRGHRPRDRRMNECHEADHNDHAREDASVDHTISIPSDCIASWDTPDDGQSNSRDIGGEKVDRVVQVVTHVIAEEPESQYERRVMTEAVPD